MEGASLRGCNFEDPAGSARAHLEGKKMLHSYETISVQSLFQRVAQHV